MDNWILRLFFQSIEKPVAQKLQGPENTEAGSCIPHSDVSFNHPTEGDAGSSEPTLPRPEILPTSQPLQWDFSTDLQSGSNDWDWNIASQFVNSEEAEKFSLYQLAPNLFTSEGCDWAAVSSNGHTLPLLDEAAHADFNSTAQNFPNLA